jgi:hypothetical protein
MQGYHLAFGCVSGPGSGAMGLHYVNMAGVGDGESDATPPDGLPPARAQAAAVGRNFSSGTT